MGNVFRIVEMAILRMQEQDCAIHAHQIVIHVQIPALAHYALMDFFCPHHHAFNAKPHVPHAQIHQVVLLVQAINIKKMDCVLLIVATLILRILKLVIAMHVP